MVVPFYVKRKVTFAAVFLAISIYFGCSFSDLARGVQLHFGLQMEEGDSFGSVSPADPEYGCIRSMFLRRMKKLVGLLFFLRFFVASYAVFIAYDKSDAEYFDIVVDVVAIRRVIF